MYSRLELKMPLHLLIYTEQNFRRPHNYAWSNINLNRSIAGRLGASTGQKYSRIRKSTWKNDEYKYKYKYWIFKSDENNIFWDRPFIDI